MLEKKDQVKESFGQKMSKGSIWVITNTIVIRLLGFISAIILARVLFPSDFGLIAIATSIIAFSQGTTQTGFDSAIIQRQENPEIYLNTIWTVELIRNIVLAIIIILLAPLISNFFNEPRVTAIIYVLSFTIVLKGLQNIGTVWFRKDLNFKSQFYFETIPLLISTVIVIPLVLLLRNVWALVLSNIILSVATCIMSYIMHPYRPKLEINIKKIKELFSFGKWILIMYFIVAIREHAVPLFISKIFNTITLGYYNRATAFSSKIFAQISEIFWRLSYPAFSKIQNDRSQLKKAYFITLQGITFFGFPMAMGFYFISYDFTHIVLTDKWIEITPFLKIMSLQAAIGFVGTPCSIAFQAIGKPGVVTKINTLGLLFIILTIYPFSYLWGVNGTLFTFLLSTVIVTTILLIKISLKLEIKIVTFIKHIFPAVINSFFMILVILSLKMWLNIPTTIYQLLLLILIGFISYIAMSILLDKIFNLGLISTFKKIYTNIKPQNKEL